MDKCYAKILGNCDGPLTREHFVSLSVLTLIAGGEDKTLSVGGFSWIPEGETKELDPKSVVSKILCYRHNEDLSRLDTEALKFFRFLHHGYDVSEEEVNGLLLEKWMLKCAIGISKVGNKSNFESTIAIEDGMISLLFNDNPIEEPRGFFFEADKPKVNLQSKAEMALIPREDIIAIFDVKVFNLSFFYNFVGNVTKVSEKKFDYGETFSYRPEYIIKQNGLKRNTMKLNWENSSGDKILLISE